MPGPDPKIEHLWLEAATRLGTRQKLLVELATAASRQIENPTGGLVYCLGYAAQVQLNRTADALRLRDDPEIDILAWACRNLQELELWLQYVLDSPANADRFIQDSVIDEITFVEAAFTILRKRGAYEPEMGEYVNSLRRAHDVKKQSSDDRGRWLSIREVARRYGREDEFLATNRMYSKLVHKTAWSLLLREKPYRLKLTFAFHASEYALGMIRLLETHVRQRPI